MRIPYATALIVLAFAACARAADPPAPPVSEELAAANLAKAVAEARKAAADAELAAAKLRLGTDINPAYTGAVTTGQGTGTIEGYLLAADAVAGAARAIVMRVAKSKPSVVILIAGEIPNFNSLIGFSLSRRVFEEAYRDTKRADDLKPPPPATPAKTPPPPGAGPLVASVALGLDSLNRILGFFRSDYSIAGSDISFEDSMLLHAVAGELAAQSLPAVLPVQYNRPAIDAGKSEVYEGLRSVAEKRAEAQGRTNALEKLIADVDERIKTEGNADKKKELNDWRTKAKEIQDKWKYLSALFDTQFGKLGVPDEKGLLPIANLVKESAINDALRTKDAQLLVVKTQKSGGSYFTKKNMWTSLGAMPFYVAGGSVASFVLFGGASGNVIDGGVVPIHGGYRRVDKIESSFQPPALPKAP